MPAWDKNIVVSWLVHHYDYSRMSFQYAQVMWSHRRLRVVSCHVTSYKETSFAFIEQVKQVVIFSGKMPQKPIHHSNASQQQSTANKEEIKD